MRGGLLLVMWSEANAELFISISSSWFHCVVSWVEVCKNTFQAFAGKLDKPIESKFKGGNGSLEGWMVLTSLNNEQRARYGYAISLQIINGREASGSAWEFTEKKTRCYCNKKQKEIVIWMYFIEIITDFFAIYHLIKWDKMTAHFIVCTATYKY